ncbi:MAG: hypothetical protein RLY17_2190 [Pseudomonadota bacterium]|jgi:hypothetical protein
MHSEWFVLVVNIHVSPSGFSRVPPSCTFKSIGYSGLRYRVLHSVTARNNFKLC